MIVLISVVPSNLVVRGMMILGRPGLIVGFLLFCWWIIVRFTSHPIRYAGRPR